MYKAKLVFAVTTDPNYDQRMIRICTSLAKNGYEVLLVGRKGHHSVPLTSQAYRQKRLSCFFQKGKLFYLEFNIRLFLFLLTPKMDLIGAIDLDTILPCYFVSLIRRKKRVYDAHELFCEMKEVVTRPAIYRWWKRVERFAVPRFRFGYTVNEPIRDILSKEYGVNYGIIMNVPVAQELIRGEKQNFVIYQGAVNQGRSFETLIPAFRWIPVPLWIFGDGNFYRECEGLIEQYGLQDKVILKGRELPHRLRSITPTALLGVTLFENNGLSNYYSLGNRFFDYIQAGIPQLCVDYPAYREINERYRVALLTSDLSSRSIADAINSLLNNPELLQEISNNCLVARNVYNWQNEEKKLLAYYQSIFRS